VFAGTTGATNADPVGVGAKHPGLLAGHVGNLEGGQEGEDPVAGLQVT